MSAAVRAAGGVVVRRGPAGAADVVVVHRPRYDDWSLPKGKAKRRETDEECALREVEEEAGLRCALGPELGSAVYLDPLGRPKRVRFWSLWEPEPGGGGPEPAADGREVDEALRLPLAEARTLLSYARERAILDEVGSGPLWLVRHGSADRRAWRGDDRDRPLDARGVAQAHALAGLLGSRPVGRIFTSPHRRCVETVWPLAVALGLPLEPRPELAEGAAAAAALATAVRGAVLCTHADVAARLVGERRCAKGSVWELQLVDGVPEPRAYLPPPARPRR